jgi:hypothetical protein
MESMILRSHGSRATDGQTTDARATDSGLSEPESPLSVARASVVCPSVTREPWDLRIIDSIFKAHLHER